MNDHTMSESGAADAKIAAAASSDARLERKRQINRLSAQRKRIREKHMMKILSEKCNELVANRKVLEMERDKLMSFLTIVKTKVPNKGTGGLSESRNELVAAATRTATAAKATKDKMNDEVKEDADVGTKRKSSNSMPDKSSSDMMDFIASGLLDLANSGGKAVSPSHTKNETVAPHNDGKLPNSASFEEPSPMEVATSEISSSRKTSFQNGTKPIMTSSPKQRESKCKTNSESNQEADVGGGTFQNPSRPRKKSETKSSPRGNQKHQPSSRRHSPTLTFPSASTTTSTTTTNKETIHSSSSSQASTSGILPGIATPAINNMLNQSYQAASTTSTVPMEAASVPAASLLPTHAPNSILENLGAFHSYFATLGRASDDIRPPNTTTMPPPLQSFYGAGPSVLPSQTASIQPSPFAFMPPPAPTNPNAQSNAIASSPFLNPAALTNVAAGALPVNQLQLALTFLLSQLAQQQIIMAQGAPSSATTITNNCSRSEATSPQLGLPTIAKSNEIGHHHSLSVGSPSQDNNLATKESAARLSTSTPTWNGGSTGHQLSTVSPSPLTTNQTEQQTLESILSPLAAALMMTTAATQTAAAPLPIPPPQQQHATAPSLIHRPPLPPQQNHINSNYFLQGMGAATLPNANGDTQQQQAQMQFLSALIMQHAASALTSGRL